MHYLQHNLQLSVHINSTVLFFFLPKNNHSWFTKLLHKSPKQVIFSVHFCIFVSLLAVCIYGRHVLAFFPLSFIYIYIYTVDCCSSSTDHSGIHYFQDAGLKMTLFTFYSLLLPVSQPCKHVRQCE